MVTFLSFLLGLVIGPQTVELAVTPEVARVELRLAGAPVAELAGPPWLTRVDFGQALLPQQLEAVAFDAEGRELATAQLQVNLPRPHAVAALVLKRGPDGQAIGARLSWENVLGEEPRAVNILFDGAPLNVEDVRDFPLPPHDLEQTHFLRAELDFGHELSSTAELAYGGALSDQVRSDLTAVAIELDPGVELPPLEQLEGWLQADGRPLSVVAAEKGRAEILVVRSEDVQEAFDRMSRQFSVTLRSSGMRTNPGRDARLAYPLAADQGLRLLFPYPQELHRQGKSHYVYQTTVEFDHKVGGVFWLIQNVRLRDRPEQPPRLSDAVAVAGMSAASRGRRRAVVLLLSGTPTDAGMLAAESARHYLEALGVPLEIWQLSTNRKERETSTWGAGTAASTLAKLGDAAQALDRALDRQRILWVEGSPLPTAISLSPAARGARLLARPPEPKPVSAAIDSP